MNLDHDQAECAGRWELWLDESNPRWKCSHCGIVYADSLPVREAAQRENEMGDVLTFLQVVGRTRP